MSQGQVSSPTGDIEMAQHSPLPSHTVDTAASEANNTPPVPTSTPWPGENFKVAQLLPGSVYLWACGERDERDGESPVSDPEFCAAWVVLIVRVEFL